MQRELTFALLPEFVLLLPLLPPRLNVVVLTKVVEDPLAHEGICIDNAAIFIASLKLELRDCALKIIVREVHLVDFLRIFASTSLYMLSWHLILLL